MDGAPSHGRPPTSRPPERGPTGPQGEAAAAALLSLSRVARSFVLYDANNATVRQLLSDYHDRMLAAIERCDGLLLTVAPFELVARGEVVYRDDDREKSLAFKLFRDGIRRVTFLPRVTWPELLRFLEILALRFTGVRQQEEDTVTLLGKAALPGIRIDAVVGFTPSEENPEPPGEAQAGRGSAKPPPAGWDVPLPPLPRPAALAPVEVPEQVLAALRQEAGEVAGLELGLARDLVAEAGRAGWPLPDPDLTSFLAEIRDALLAEGRLDVLRRLVDVLGEGGGGELRDALLRSLGDARTLALVLESVPPDAARLPEALVPFLPLLGLEALLDEIASTPHEARRRLLLQIVLSRLPREADPVLARLSKLEPRLARDLGRGVVARAPQRAGEVARHFLAQADEALRAEGLEALAAAPDIPLRPVAELLGDASEIVRVRAAELLERRGDESVVAALRARLEEAAPSPREAEALGRALAAVAPIAAGRIFGPWLEPKARFLRGLSPQQRAQQWAAVAGLGAVPGAGAEAALTALAERADPDLKRHCLATLARRRKEQRGPSHPGR